MPRGGCGGWNRISLHHHAVSTHDDDDTCKCDVLDFLSVDTLSSNAVGSLCYFLGIGAFEMAVSWMKAKSRVPTFASLK